MSATSAPANTNTPAHAPSPFPRVRRVVTGHDSDGKSKFDVDDEVEPYHFRGGPSVFNDVFWTDEAKPDLSHPFVDESKDHVGELVSKDGSAFKVTDTPPGQKSVRPDQLS